MTTKRRETRCRAVWQVAGRGVVLCLLAATVMLVCSGCAVRARLLPSRTDLAPVVLPALGAATLILPTPTPADTPLPTATPTVTSTPPRTPTPTFTPSPTFSLLVGPAASLLPIQTVAYTPLPRRVLPTPRFGAGVGAIPTRLPRDAAPTRTVAVPTHIPVTVPTPTTAPTATPQVTCTQTRAW
ncbi:MAG: hypothetical protein ACYC4R_01250 [Anaerolineae bacterium]